jgi:hypothetical protein
MRHVDLALLVYERDQAFQFFRRLPQNKAVGCALLAAVLGPMYVRLPESSRVD